MPSRFFLLALPLLASCVCRTPGIDDVDPARLIASPNRLDFPATWVGQQATATLEITNVGGVTALADVSVELPFSCRSCRRRRS